MYIEASMLVPLCVIARVSTMGPVMIRAHLMKPRHHDPIIIMLQMYQCLSCVMVCVHNIHDLFAWSSSS